MSFRQLLDPLRNFLCNRLILNRISIHRGDFAVNRFSTAPRHIYIYRDLMLDRSWQILDPSRCNFFKYLQGKIRFHFSLDRFSFSLLPNTFPSLQTSYPLGFRPRLCFSSLVSVFNPSFFMLHAFRPRFWVFFEFLGFLKIVEIFMKVLGWVLFIWWYMIMHCIPLAYSQCFMHLDVCLIV